MNAPHPSFLFQADDQIELGRRRAAKAARLCVPSSSFPSVASPPTSGSASYASLGHPIFLGTKQDDVAELALGGSGADGGREKVLDALLEVPAAGGASGRGMWTAESGGIVRRVDLSTGKTTDVVLAHKAPVSALALLPLPTVGQSLLFSSGWDKVIHIHLIVPLSPSDKIPASPRRLKPLLTIAAASTDFIKALEVLPEQGVLLSGGSEKVIRIWDLRPLIAWAQGTQGSQGVEAPVPRSAGSFGEHTRGITCITSLPPPPTIGSSTSATTSGDLPMSTTIYSADSMGRIFQLSLDLGEHAGKTSNGDTASTSRSTGSSSLPPRARLVIQRELRGPETAVSDIHVGWNVQREEVDDDDDDEDGTHRPVTTAGALVRAQVWVASNDKSVQLFVPFERDTRSSKTSSRPSTSKRLPLNGSSSSSTTSSTTLSRVSKVGAALGSQPPLAPILAIRHPDYVKSVLPLAVAAASEAGFGSAALPKSVVVSGSADEDIRVWKVAGLGGEDADAEDAEDEEEEETGDEARQRSLDGQVQRSSPAKLLRRQEGHWHEVEKLLLWYGSLLPASDRGTVSLSKLDLGPNHEEEGAQATPSPIPSVSQEEQSAGKEKAEWHIISASLDGSIRRWPLAHLLEPQSIAERTLIEKGADALPGAAHAGADGSGSGSAGGSAGSNKVNGSGPASQPGRKSGSGATGSGMTAEEERELEELMGSDLDE
ncbi:hypothetical protein BCV69DRAFT_298231 [Microstroma glucosiphilum]|uniref:Uncharacterized protein n=1 Tax=Pseudomicrostroma glucosiphilum TaxID=1684307 RepID=A0A316UA04_9BASI|nr:hypothetical protein BCV69DRAFT_298231 [Pseudomicrostroma glucosiphilum]PWN22036.1 hypothetical protein BCV69DRAFT_298231 [Pseudomicrostroma glucosiphilum]